MSLGRIWEVKHAIPENCSLTSFSGGTYFEIDGDVEEQKIKEIITDLGGIKILNSIEGEWAV